MTSLPRGLLASRRALSTSSPAFLQATFAPSGFGLKRTELGNSNESSAAESFKGSRNPRPASPASKQKTANKSGRFGLQTNTPKADWTPRTDEESLKIMQSRVSELHAVRQRAEEFRAKREAEVGIPHYGREEKIRGRRKRPEAQEWSEQTVYRHERAYRQTKKNASRWNASREPESTSKFPMTNHKPTSSRSPAAKTSAVPGILEPLLEAQMGTSRRKISLPKIKPVILPPSRQLVLTKKGLKPSASLLPHKPTTAITDAKKYTSFTSPPLLPGIVKCIHELVGSTNARPTPIQSLSIAHIVSQLSSSRQRQEYGSYLLASETGSGKSIAYLMPVIQSLKFSESTSTNSSRQENALAPRALVLAPTHELARQLAGFAKALCHEVKAKVLCASRANMPTRVSSSDRDEQTEPSSRKMRDAAEALFADEATTADKSTSRSSRPVDILTATPMKALELTRGRGWERSSDPAVNPLASVSEIPSDGKDWTVGKPEMNLRNVEWVVVDEGDVLFDPDFQATTRLLLADIARARGVDIPFAAEGGALSSSSSTQSPTSSPSKEITYPFNLILSSATTPSSLLTYLSTHHPIMTHLTSPNLHQLPSGLKTEVVEYTGGETGAGKWGAVEQRIKEVWMDDVVKAEQDGTREKGKEKSKILVFVNRSNKVLELGKWLEERGMKTVRMTSAVSTSDDEDGKGAGMRTFGANRALAGFLKDTSSSSTEEEPPRVLITTSLLSRGLDFGKDVSYVFVLDEPRNAVDFLHRAGRTARAGNVGKLVMFRKAGGRRRGGGVVDGVVKAKR